MTKAIKSIVIVGGGAAGWITAGTLAAKIRSQHSEGIQISLVESPKTPIIGVGEGTWPTMRNTLKKMGVRETDFLRECNVSFKQGAKFVHWCTGQKDDFYYHPLVLPQGFSEINLAPHWLANPHNQSFSNAVCVQETLCEAGLAPKLITTPEYAAVANYAYHLDAGAFAEFLKKHCTTIYGLLHFANNRACENRIRLQPYIRPVNELAALAMMVIRSHRANQPSGFAYCIEPMAVQAFQCVGLTYFHQLRLSCNRWS